MRRRLLIATILAALFAGFAVAPAGAAASTPPSVFCGGGVPIPC